ncbi:transposase [Candidatus Poribacteria bacterium]|nr:transposase [Candidatus Poribacteria bacterium]MYG08988.1 transposase [Candidatus Poribacteria bacterium]MYK22850.1 transposase [Candidatus Poribacteria bacterium]
MKSKSNFPQRRAMRLRDYDYSQPGVYFVTTCVQHRKCIFGTIIDGKMQLNEIGQIVVECWNHIRQHFPTVQFQLGGHVIMPNHFHGIISWGITEARDPQPPVGARSPRPPENINPRRGEVSPPDTTNPTRRGEISSPTLGKIMAYFKYQSTKHINQHHNTPGTRIWQRNYHDHIIRDDPDLQRLRQYIQDNPMKWELDQLHPDNPSRW